MVVLLSGASLLLRSFQAMTRIEPGFDANALTVRLSLPRKDYSDNQKITRFYDELEARVRALPGVQSVAATNHIPLNGALASSDTTGRGPAPLSTTSSHRAVPHGHAALLPRDADPGRGGTGVRRATAPLRRPSRSSARLSCARASGPRPGGPPASGRRPQGFRPIEIIGVAETSTT
jgi:hypothetical protein